MALVKPLVLKSSILRRLVVLRRSMGHSDRYGVREPAVHLVVRTACKGVAREIDDSARACVITCRPDGLHKVPAAVSGCAPEMRMS